MVNWFSGTGSSGGWGRGFFSLYLATCVRSSFPSASASASYWPSSSEFLICAGRLVLPCYYQTGQYMRLHENKRSYFSSWDIWTSKLCSIARVLSCSALVALSFSLRILIVNLSRSRRDLIFWYSPRAARAFFNAGC